MPVSSQYTSTVDYSVRLLRRLFKSSILSTAIVYILYEYMTYCIYKQIIRELYGYLHTNNGWLCVAVQRAAGRHHKGTTGGIGGHYVIGTVQVQYN